MSTMATDGQLLTSAGTATITVVSNASGQTLLVQPTTIVNQSPSRHAITKQGCSSPMLEGGEEAVSDDEGNRNAGTLVENTHYITVPEGATDARSYTSLTPVTPAIETDPITSNEVTHSTFVQYVDAPSDQAIYTANGQMAYPVYTVNDSGATMYSTSSAHYYQTNNNNPVTYSQVIRVANNVNHANNQSQIISNGPYIIQQNVETDHTIITATTRDPSPSDVSYLIDDTTTSNVTDSASTPPTAKDISGNNSSSSQNSSDNPSSISQCTRIPPVTVQWLLDNYETADGVSLPRSTMYNYYMQHCTENKIDPVNAASFGKLIRSVFLGLRTRRLGTRGNSKYHYYGIRLKSDSALHNYTVSEKSMVNKPTTGNASQSQKRSRASKIDSNDTQFNNTSQNQTTVSCQSELSPGSQYQQYLGDGSSAIPDFPEINLTSETFPEDCSLDDIDTFKSIYRDHCEMLLHSIENLEFSTIESLWREFWRCQVNLDECEEEKYLSKAKLYSLSKCIEVQNFVQYIDYRFYQNLVKILIPDVLRPIPSSLTQSIRNFAKSLENWLQEAMIDCPREVTLIKLNAVNALSQTLRRYTSLNHLAQAARAVLQNSTQINQMLTDLNRVDFLTVQEQAAWVSECDTNLVKRLEEDFKLTLQQRHSLEEWAKWLKSVVDEILKPHIGKQVYIRAARQFLLKWSFYSSMIIRDLTLRSAASFGSFHLIRLLYDEYMFYIIEHLVAEATGEIPMAVMGGKFDTILSNSNDFDVLNHKTDQNNGLIQMDSFNDNVSDLLLTSNSDILEMNSAKRQKIS